MYILSTSSELYALSHNVAVAYSTQQETAEHHASVVLEISDTFLVLPGLCLRVNIPVADETFDKTKRKENRKI
jgi:hypothetical protein